MSLSKVIITIIVSLVDFHMTEMAQSYSGQCIHESDKNLNKYVDEHEVHE